LARVAERVADRAGHHLGEARARRRRLPRQARSPLLIVTLAETYLQRLRRARFDPYDAYWSAVRPPMLRLALRSLISGF
jgi:phytoene synthase